MRRVGEDIWRLASWAFLCADLGDALVPFYFNSRWGCVCQCQSGTEEYGGDSGGLHSCFRYLQFDLLEKWISKLEALEQGHSVVGLLYDEFMDTV